MTARLYLYDDATARGFAPFTLTRPVSELRAGTSLIRERWAKAFNADVGGFISAEHLREFDEPGAPSMMTERLPAGSILANSRCVVPLSRMPNGTVFIAGEHVAAVRLARELDVVSLADGRTTLDDLAAASGAITRVTARWLDAPWAFIRDLGAQLADDIPALASTLTLDEKAAERTHIVGVHPVFVERGATIEPYTVFDVSAGPILVRTGATVSAFTRVVGPCYIGEGSTVAGDKITGCSIGEKSRVHGEISTSIVLGCSNKSHDGFVGHSYLGRWVNLGAGTTTSNLKNTYGTVQLWTSEGMRETGLQFLGTLFGDHAKTGIGMRLTTGTVVEAGANVYGSMMPPKHVPAFAWGETPPYGRYSLDKFLEVAERVMHRRDVTLTDKGRAQLRAAYERAPGSAKRA